MPEKLTVCVKCGGPLEQSMTGKPRVYCGPACRQAAAYEIQRLNRRLIRLEERASGLRHSRSSTRDWLCRTPEQALADTEAEIAASEIRLRLLLAEAKGETE
jgi:hypothetical protein